MKLDKLTRPGWADAADYFRERHKKYGTSEWSTPAVVKPETDDDALAPALTTFGEQMECLDNVPGISQIPQETSPPGCSHMMPGSGKLQSNTTTPGLAPTVESD